MSRLKVRLLGRRTPSRYIYLDGSPSFSIAQMIARERFDSIFLPEHHFKGRTVLATIDFVHSEQDRTGISDLMPIEWTQVIPGPSKPLKAS
jgi:hypothetical protein